MNLRLNTDYALRVLLYLAHADQQVSVEAMAGGYGVPDDLHNDGAERMDVAMQSESPSP